MRIYYRPPDKNTVTAKLGQVINPEASFNKRQIGGMLYQPEDEGKILDKTKELCQKRMFKSSLFS